MNASQAPEPARGSGKDGARSYDPRERLTATRLQHANPHWLLLWGTHSRRYYAFPLFTAPRGIIITSPDPDRLLGRMRQTEAITATSPGVPPAPLPEIGRSRLSGQRHHPP